MKPVTTRLKRLSRATRVSLVISAVLVVVIAVTLNNALSVQELRTRASLTAIPAGVGYGPPNPFLANSVWPDTHANSYQQDGIAGPALSTTTASVKSINLGGWTPVVLVDSR